MANNPEKCRGCPFVNALDMKVDQLRQQADSVATSDLNRMHDDFREWSRGVLALEEALRMLNIELADPKTSSEYQQLEAQYLCADSNEDQIDLMSRMKRYLRDHSSRVFQLRQKRLALVESYDEENDIQTGSDLDSIDQTFDENLRQIEDEINRLLGIINAAKEGCRKGGPGLTWLGHVACSTESTDPTLTPENRRGLYADSVIVRQKDDK
ncbi:MAG: hypothetical protein WBB94_02480 [Candidatus Saccharimonadaceae bacterium]